MSAHATGRAWPGWRALWERAAHRRVLLWRLALVCALILAANYVSAWLVAHLGVEVMPSNEHLVHRYIIASVILYALLIAIPFVPAVELGLALIFLLGADLALIVYLFTVLGLGLAFVAGRWIPQAQLRLLLELVGLRRASRLIEELEPLDLEQRLHALVSRAPARLVPLLVRYRYLAVAVALNLPGNMLLGGGGGISLAAGMSRLFSPPAFVATLALAVAPVPLLIYLFGTDVLL